MGAPEVGDDPDRWAPPVGECVREGRERWAGGLSWAGRVWWADWREEKKGEELGRGPDGERKGVWGLFFSFFQILFKQLFKPLFKSNILHLFHNLFSQIIFKDF
jgi:hypothetical protein